MHRIGLLVFAIAIGAVSGAAGVSLIGVHGITAVTLVIAWVAVIVGAGVLSAAVDVRRRQRQQAEE